MGWASYLADIYTRFDDNGHQSNAMVGPTGSGEKRISPELLSRVDLDEGTETSLLGKHKRPAETDRTVLDSTRTEVYLATQ